MALHMRQALRMRQQLVLTPQLQQAIKLLQLSRFELQDLVRSELLENPLLEESRELGTTAEEPVSSVEMQDGLDSPEQRDESGQKADQPQQEVKIEDAPGDNIDWDAYLENSSYSPAVSSGATRRHCLRAVEELFSVPPADSIR